MLQLLGFVYVVTLISQGDGLPQVGESTNNSPLQTNVTNCGTPGQVTNVIVQGGVAGPQGERGETGQDGATGPPGPRGLSGLSAGGVTYTRWGRTSCPTGTQRLYEGFVAGSRWDQAGSASYLCLHETPQFLRTTPGQQERRTRLHTTEYEARASPPAFGNMYGHDAPCAVCYAPTRTAMITIPARTSCPSSWTREYYGYLMADRSDGAHHSGRVPICVDASAESVGGSAARIARSQLFFTEITCDGTVCPPYSDGAEIACVVCTK